MGRRRDGGAGRRPAGAALVLALAVLTACSAEPSAGPAKPPTQRELRLEWMHGWAEQVDAWSVAYLGVIRELDESEGAVPVPVLNAWGRRLSGAAADLDDGLRAAGPVDLEVAPTYPQALDWALEHVRAAAADAETCAAEECEAAVSWLLDTSQVLWHLTLKTAAVEVLETGETRTSRPDAALLAAADLGGVELGDRLDPLDHLCVPDFEDVPDLEPPETTLRTALTTSERMPVFEQVQQWESPVAAARHFDVLDVRAIACAVLRVEGADAESSWSIELGPDLSVHTAAWRGETRTSTGTLHSLGLSALVDDTVVVVLLLSALDEPSSEDGEALLRRAVAGLGVDPEPAG